MSADAPERARSSRPSLLATAPREVTEDDAAAILRRSLELW